MKLFSLAKESGDLNVDEAIDIVNKQDSTNPLDMQQVKSYQEELEELEKAEQDNQDDSGDATDSEAQTPDNNSGESTDNVEQESTGDETVGDIVDQPEDNSKDKESKTEEKTEETTETKETTENSDSTDAEPDQAGLEKAVECFDILCSAFEQFKVSKAKGGMRLDKAQSLMQDVTSKAKALGFDYSPSVALESLGTTNTYTSQRKGTELALEGLGEMIKDVVNKIIAFVKSVISWLRDFFFFDEIKDAKKEKDLFVAKAKIAETEKKVKELNQYVGKLQDRFNNQVHTQNTSVLLKGNKTKDAGDMIMDVYDSLVFLMQYWKNTTEFVSNRVLPEFAKADALIQQGASDSVVTILPTASEFAPVAMMPTSQYQRYEGINNPPDGFDIYVSKDSIVGNLHYSHCLPSKHVLASETNSRSFQAKFVKEADTSGREDKGITFTTEVKIYNAVLDQFAKADDACSNVELFVNRQIKELSHIPQRLNNFLKDFDKTEDINTFKRTILYNLGVVTGLFDKPLLESIRIYFKIRSSFIAVQSRNVKAMEGFIKDTNDKIEQLELKKN